jgi:hypothetical protein
VVFGACVTVQVPPQTGWRLVVGAPGQIVDAAGSHQLSHVVLTSFRCTCSIDAAIQPSSIAVPLMSSLEPVEVKTTLLTHQNKLRMPSGARVHQAVFAFELQRCRFRWRRSTRELERSGTMSWSTKRIFTNSVSGYTIVGDECNSVVWCRIQAVRRPRRGRAGSSEAEYWYQLAVEVDGAWDV